jgi:hypothetical protein
MTIPENVIVSDSVWKIGDIDVIFGPLEPNEVIHWTEAKDLPNLLKEMGIFCSTSEARRAGRNGPIPSGFTKLKASKIRTIWIWNPTT